jgi:DNA-directed RNA polymerase specialized sigma24 family protein
MTAPGPPRLTTLIADPLRPLVEASLTGVRIGSDVTDALARPALAAAVDAAATEIAAGFHPFGESLPGLWRIADEWLEPEPFPVRAYNALVRANVRSWGDLAALKVLDLYEIRNFGPLSVRATAHAALRRIIALALDPATGSRQSRTLAGVLPLRPRRSEPAPPRPAVASAPQVLAGGYARCPACRLVTPLDEAADVGPAADQAPVHADPRARCAVCGHAFDGFAAALSLPLRVRCGGCQAWFRAAREAALMRCPACGRRSVGPYLDAAGQQRLAHAIAERERVGRLVTRFLGRLEPAAGQLAADGHAVVPLRARPRPPAAIQPGLARVNGVAPLARSVRAALDAAVHSLPNPRERAVLMLRYGLDGEGARTFAEIGRQHGYSPTRARQYLHQGLSSLRGLAFRDPTGRGGPAVSLARLAAEVLGEPSRPGPAARVRALLDAALPGVHPASGADLLLCLAEDAGAPLTSALRRAFRAEVAAVAAVRTEQPVEHGRPPRS